MQQADITLFIAVIDDSPTVCKILETALTREGYIVKTFNTPLEAFRAFLRRDREFPLPNIIFIDLRLPQVDGYEVMKRFRQAEGGKHIHFIAISRLNSVLDRLKAKLAGANDYIPKPFQTAHIVEVVKRYEQS